LSKLLQIIGEEVSSSFVRLVLLDKSSQVVFEHAWPGPEKSCVSASENIIQRVLQEKRPLLEGYKDRSSWNGSQSDAVWPNQPLLCLPLSGDEQPVGAICLFRDLGQSPYSEEDLELLACLSQALKPFLKNGGDHNNTEGFSHSPQGEDFLIGQSGSSSRIRTLIEKVKDTDAPVFISGESGTGKEIIARSIHERGARRVGSFVAVNCGAIPDPLLESELFGHARGAFTGALRDKAGLIEEANGGTFFLDEVGDLSLPLQAKLLRLLQEKEIRRVGETRTRRVDVRFVSATNKNIEKEIELGNFRMDLYYRLRILTIEVPPLRERKADLLLLVDHFLERYCREMRRGRAYFSPRAMELLMDYSWPGNIRELQNEIQRSLVLSGPGGLIKEDCLSAKVNPQRGTPAAVSYNFFEAKADFEKRFLTQALLRFGHNKARTAEAVGLSRQGLFKLMKKHKLGNCPRT